jgi:hypothetical protein
MHLGLRDRTKHKAKSSKNEEELEKASWFKDAFTGLGIAANGGATKKHAPLPEALFDLDGERSIKTIHQCNEAQPSNVGTTPPKKGKTKELINISSKEEADADKESAPSLGRQGRSRAAAAIGEEESPASSDEDDGQAPGAADSG